MNPYVIPGLEEKQEYINKLRPCLKSGSQVGRNDLRRIYRQACIHFNISPDTEHSSRKRKACMARHWTVFIGKCKGLTNHYVANYFCKDPSTAQHSVKKIINEIEVYTRAKETFEYFINEESLMTSIGDVKNSKLKTWLYQFYNNYQQENGMLASLQPISIYSQTLSEVKTMLKEIMKEKENIYQEVLSARERHMVKTAIKKIEDVTNDKNTGENSHIIL
jgi:hypothetical protein